MPAPLNKTQRKQSDRTYADGYDALRAMLAEYSSETVAEWLIAEGYWPQGPVNSAAARVRACLDPEKNQFFKFSEIIFLSVRSGCPDALYYFCDQMCRQRPEATKTSRERAIESLREIQQLERELHEKKSLYNAAMRADQHVPPTARGISRIRFSLTRLFRGE